MTGREAAFDGDYCSTIERALPALKRKRFLLQAEYRHAWDYETPDKAEACYRVLLEAAARQEAYEVIVEYGKGSWRRGESFSDGQIEKLVQQARDRLGNTLRYPAK